MRKLHYLNDYRQLVISVSFLNLGDLGGWGWFFCCVLVLFFVFDGQSKCALDSLNFYSKGLVPLCHGFESAPNA